MSRVRLIDKLYASKRKSALEFNYDALVAPPLACFLTQYDIDALYKIATSIKYSSNLKAKYKMIDDIMQPKGFKRAGCGTNRVVYNYLNDVSFCIKIALDKVGMSDSPREFNNQEYFKPFCCKIFEVDPTGVVACVERVNPISSIEEFSSVAEDVYNMMVTKIIGRYVVDDLGTTKFMNYGIRYNSNGTTFGPVVIDFPYAFKLDINKTKCSRTHVVNGVKVLCGGEIDYDDGMNNLVCTKCGAKYSASELADTSHTPTIGGIMMYTGEEYDNKYGCKRAIITNNDKILYAPMKESSVYMDIENFNSNKGGYFKMLGERKAVPRRDRMRVPRITKSLLVASAIENHRAEVINNFEKCRSIVPDNTVRTRKAVNNRTSYPSDHYDVSTKVEDVIKDTISKSTDTPVVEENTTPYEEPVEDITNEAPVTDIDVAALMNKMIGINSENITDYSSYSCEDATEDTDTTDDTSYDDEYDYDEEDKKRTKKKFTDMEDY